MAAKRIFADVLDFEPLNGDKPTHSDSIYEECSIAEKPWADVSGAPATHEQGTS